MNSVCGAKTTSQIQDVDSACNAGQISNIL